MSVTVLFVCLSVCLFFVFVRLRISPARIKLAASNFARGSSASWAGNLPFWGNLLPQKPKSDESVASPAHVASSHKPRVGSACVDIRPYTKTGVYFIVVYCCVNRHNGKTECTGWTVGYMRRRSKLIAACHARMLMSQTFR